MAAKFHLQIITPHRIFLDEEVEKVIIRTVTGDIAVLNDHIPMVTPISVGKITIITDGKTREAAMAAGFAHIDLDKTVIMTDSAEWPEEIDVERAKKAKDRAMDRIKSSQGNIDMIRAELALNKALNRINVAEKIK